MSALPGVDQFAKGIVQRFGGKIRVEPGEGIAQALFQEAPPRSRSARRLVVSGAMLGPWSMFQPRLFNQARAASSTVDSVMAVKVFATSSSWISFNDRLLASFHSVRPLLALPNRTPAAVEGEVKM